MIPGADIALDKLVALAETSGTAPPEFCAVALAVLRRGRPQQAHCRALGAALAGKRIGIKDTVCVAGIPTTCASRLLYDYVPDVDATIVRRIIEAGGLRRLAVLRGDLDRVHGLALAGDWTRTDWTTTMEGACQSAARAVDIILEFARLG